VVAIADIPKHEAADLNLAPALYIALDQIQDPGNAGTIIRIADWFGINTVFFSEGSVDVYNPKVVSSAKGSLFRTACHYVNLAQLFETNKALPVYGTFMEGENIYKTELASQGFIVIGNEANGISQEVAAYVTNKISIPNFGKAESLNAAVATGIVVSEFKRK
jgi:TrmH family RNA methyltransferase